MLQKADDPLDTRNGLFGNPFLVDDDEEEGTADDLAGFGIQVRVSDKQTPVYRSAATD